MRKALLSIAACSLIAVSCNKSGQQPAPASQATVDQTPATQTAARPGGPIATNPATQEWKSSVGDCVLPAVNCLPEIIVKPTRKLELNAIATGGPTNVGSYFSSPTGELCADELRLSDAQLAKLASGTYRLIATGSSLVSGRMYYLAGPTATLTPTNVEFVITAK